MDRLTPRFAWQRRQTVEVSPELLAAGGPLGLSERLVGLLAARGHGDPAALDAWAADPRAGLRDAQLLPDAAAFVDRVRRAVDRAERVLVFGDFDADGLTGLAILALALRRHGLDAATYVPDRAEEGHGLSLGAVERARREARTLIVTADCGTSSSAEIAVAASHGIDVLVTDHHRPPPSLPAAAAVVNPMRADSAYPDRDLSGAGVALKCAQLLIGDEALSMSDLAAIGTVADVAPLVGENRSIVRLGIELMRRDPRPGVAALLVAARVDPARLTPETLAFGLVPRLNAGGRVGDAGIAARLLLCQTKEEATALAAELESANLLRRELLATALAEARVIVEQGPDEPVTVVAGPWPPGIIGLVAGRLADERGRPAIVFCDSSDPWRGSARSSRFDIVGALAAMAELFERYGGHAAAAGCHMAAANYDEFRRRMAERAAGLQPIEPSLLLDLVVDPPEVDYRLLRELIGLEPAGAGNPQPLVGIRGLTVGRVRRANGGHTQLVLKKGTEVLDAICFGRDDLPELLSEGERIDVVARLDSRAFGGYESLQLEVRDIGPPGSLDLIEAPIERMTVGAWAT
ncbi:single-stranded-DNA-specific exonuclease RecJ [soil metagenome]